MTSEEAHRQFAEMAARAEHEIELDRAALLVAAEEYPHLDVDRYLAQLDLFADEARARQDVSSEPLTRLRGLNGHLFHELGFNGNVENYYDARNSFLNDVMDRRTGIPITLSVVYLEVARRLPLPVVGVGLPGHFIVKYRDRQQQVFIDPFHRGRILSEADCREMVEKLYGRTLAFRQSFLDAVTKKQILTRMLQNLKGIYARAADCHKMLAVSERLLLLNPEAPGEVRDRGLAYFGLNRYAQALADLEAYLRLQPRAKDAAAVKERIAELRQRQARLN
jgi:regulator of sirC expression with transglutaminase-like and TPR domain